MASSSGSSWNYGNFKIEDLADLAKIKEIALAAVHGEPIAMAISALVLFISGKGFGRNQSFSPTRLLGDQITSNDIEEIFNDDALKAAVFHQVEEHNDIFQDDFWTSEKSPGIDPFNLVGETALYKECAAKGPEAVQELLDDLKEKFDITPKLPKEVDDVDTEHTPWIFVCILLGKHVRTSDPVLRNFISLLMPVAFQSAYVRSAFCKTFSPHYFKATVVAEQFVPLARIAEINASASSDDRNAQWENAVLEHAKLKPLNIGSLKTFAKMSSKMVNIRVALYLQAIGAPNSDKLVRKFADESSTADKLDRVLHDLWVIKQIRPDFDFTKSCPI